MNAPKTIKVGIVGYGALGSALAQAILNKEPGFENYELIAVSDKYKNKDLPVPNLYGRLDDMAKRCDLLVEALPPDAAPELAEAAYKHGKPLVMISSCALLLHPEILEMREDTHSAVHSPIYVPAGALHGMKNDLKQWHEWGITQAKIKSTKGPNGFRNSPYVESLGISLDQLDEPICIFKGSARQAAEHFPKNVNVAATLSYAGVGPDATEVEIWVDPDAEGNTHEVSVSCGEQQFSAKVSSKTDPNNPKTSTSTADSLIEVVKDLNQAVIHFAPPIPEPDAKYGEPAPA